MTVKDDIACAVMLEPALTLAFCRWRTTALKQNVTRGVSAAIRDLKCEQSKCTHLMQQLDKCIAAEKERAAEAASAAAEAQQAIAQLHELLEAHSALTDQLDGMASNLSQERAKNAALQQEMAQWERTRTLEQLRRDELMTGMTHSLHAAETEVRDMKEQRDAGWAKVREYSPC
jgi:ABC-type transporter Mla subunit MlaD